MPHAHIIHAHFGDEGEKLAWAKACGAIKTPLVVSLHGFDVNQLLARGGSHYRTLFRHASRIIATTRFMAGQVMALGCPAEKLVRIPIGIRTATFPFAARHWNRPEPLRLLTVARLVEFKGVDVALRAVARVVATGAPIHYTVVGAGPLSESLKRLASTLGIAGNVTFLGALGREDVVRQYQSAHLFVFPSRTAQDGAQEGQGIVLQEAQACGLPVVATRHGGIPEGCQEGVSAVLVPENDDAALAAGLLQMIERRSTWGEMGQAGRTLVQNRFDLSGHLDRVEQVYRELLAGQPHEGDGE